MDNQFTVTPKEASIFMLHLTSNLLLQVNYLLVDMQCTLRLHLAVLEHLLVDLELRHLVDSEHLSSYMEVHQGAIRLRDKL